MTAPLTRYVFAVTLLCGACASKPAEPKSEGHGTDSSAVSTRKSLERLSSRGQTYFGRLVETSIPEARREAPSPEDWFAVLAGSHRVFWEYLGEDRNPEDLEAFLDQFGVHGPQADFRLLFCVPNMSLPGIRLGGTPDATFEERSGISADSYTTVRLEFCRAQVNGFLKDPEKLRRYYHAILWEGGLLSAGDNLRLSTVVTRTEDALTDSAPAHKVWYVRDALVLAAATGQIERMLGAEPSATSIDWDAWRSWYNRNRSRLVFDKKSLTWRHWYLGMDTLRTKVGSHVAFPRDPFDDWRGPPAPPRDMVDEFGWRREGLGPGNLRTSMSKPVKSEVGR